jgi:hypothetical protein
MGTFDFMEPIHHIYIMHGRLVSSERFIPFCTFYFNDPWNIPSSKMSCEGQSHTGMAMPLSTTEIEYQSFLDSSTDHDPVTSQIDEEDLVLEPVWATSSSCSHEFLYETSPSDEDIIEAMSGSEKTWDDTHHLSFFLLEIARVEQDEFRSTLNEILGHVIVPLDTHDIYAKIKMVSISPTVMIDISRIPRKIDNVYIGVDCSPR